MTVLDHTYLTSCWWRFWTTPSWQALSDSFGPHLLGKLLVTFLDRTYLASCWWRFWTTPILQAVGDSFGPHLSGKTLVTVLDRTFLELSECILWQKSDLLSTLYVCNRAERRRREARRETFTTPELVTTRRSILVLSKFWKNIYDRNCRFLTNCEVWSKF